MKNLRLQQKIIQQRLKCVQKKIVTLTVIQRQDCLRPSLTQSIENNKLLTTYDVADAVISIKDNDVNFAPSAVDDNLSAIEGVKSIVIPGTQLISNDTDANTSML